MIRKERDVTIYVGIGGESLATMHHQDVEALIDMVFDEIECGAKKASLSEAQCKRDGLKRVPITLGLSMEIE